MKGHNISTLQQKRLPIEDFTHHFLLILLQNEPTYVEQPN